MPKQVAQKAFIHVGLCVFTQQVCNRLKRSQLKDPWSRAQSSPEGNYNHNAFTPHARRTDREEKGGNTQLCVTVMTGDSSFQYPNEVLKGKKTWLTHQPIAILALTGDDCPSGTYNRQTCQDPYLISADCQSYFPQLPSRKAKNIFYIGMQHKHFPSSVKTDILKLAAAQYAERQH